MTMNWHESLAHGMAIGDAIGLGESLGATQRLLLEAYASERSAAALVAVMLSEVEAVLDGKRQNLFFCLRENRPVRIKFRERYGESGLNPKDQSAAEIYAFARKIEDEYNRSNSSQMRLSALPSANQRNQAAVKAADEKLAVSTNALAAAKAAIAKSELKCFSEAALSGALVDEATEILAGNRDAAYLSQSVDARRDYRCEAFRLSDTLRKMPKEELEVRLGQLAKDVRAIGKAKRGE
jgi:hypothetical protein